MRAALGLPDDATEDEVMEALALQVTARPVVVPPGHVLILVAELAALEGEVVDTRCRVQNLYREAYLRENRAAWIDGHRTTVTS